MRKGGSIFFLLLWSLVDHQPHTAYKNVFYNRSLQHACLCLHMYIFLYYTATNSSWIFLPSWIIKLLAFLPLVFPSNLTQKEQLAWNNYLLQKERSKQLRKFLSFSPSVVLLQLCPFPKDFLGSKICLLTSLLMMIVMVVVEHTRFSCAYRLIVFCLVGMTFSLSPFSSQRR